MMVMFSGSPDMEILRRQKEGGTGHESYPSPGEHVITHVLSSHNPCLPHLVSDDREVWHKVVTSLTNIASNSYICKLRILDLK